MLVEGGFAATAATGGAAMREVLAADGPPINAVVLVSLSTARICGVMGEGQTKACSNRRPSSSRRNLISRPRHPPLRDRGTFSIARVTIMALTDYGADHMRAKRQYVALPEVPCANWTPARRAASCWRYGGNSSPTPRPSTATISVSPTLRSGRQQGCSAGHPRASSRCWNG